MKLAWGIIENKKKEIGEGTLLGKNLICDKNEGNRGKYFGVGILFVFVKVLQGGFSTVPSHFQYHSEKEEIFLP